MKKNIIAALIAALATTLATTGALAQSKISDGVVKIGVLTDMSGQFSHEGGKGAVTAVQMAVEDFGGKVLGAPIEVVVADHLNKPDVASATAREWFDTQKVDMITELINSAIALGVTNIAKEKNRIAIVNGSGSSATDRRRVHAEQHPTTRTTPTPSRTAPARRCSTRASTRGSSSPPTTRSARRSKATRPRS